ncbi:hypothetical protein BASA50_003121 [Batrachochytrium salamandrivorans]|uniref:Uncharacterized protein n=1 Tax=Batrachochytrium salamandrivorans TaxID=1357716 RepID=A0ABQ8FM97_9FUNG|nr:hypothetical protein BASA50_003121 [Batrachochytrium salamandrivorans]
MKLAAATLFSLAATATYASPAAYPENQVDVQHSEVDEPISTHMERHTEDQQEFMKVIKDIHKSADYKHRLKQRRKQQQRLQEYQGSNCFLSFFNKAVFCKGDKEHQKPKSPEEALRKWRDYQLLDPDLYGYRDGKIVYPECTLRGKRPDLVELSDKVHAQLGTTNKKKKERIESWEKTGDEKEENTRPEQGYDFYQDLKDEYRKYRESEEGIRCHYEYIRKLEERRLHTSFSQALEDRIDTAIHMHDPPEPVPKVIEAETVPGDVEIEHPKLLENILKKTYINSGHERKVNFKPIIKIVNGDNSEKEGHLERKVSSDRFSFKWFMDRLKGKGSTDITSEQSEDVTPLQSKIPTEGFGPEAPYE